MLMLGGLCTRQRQTQMVAVQKWRRQNCECVHTGCVHTAETLVGHQCTRNIKLYAITAVFNGYNLQILLSAAHTKRNTPLAQETTHQQ